MWFPVQPECPRHDNKILVKQIFTNTDGGLKIIGYCPNCKHHDSNGWYAYEYRQQELVEIALNGEAEVRIIAYYEHQLTEQEPD